MSEKQMHRQRWHQKLQYVYAYDKWLSEEPPFWALIRRYHWKKCRPIYEEYVK